MDLVDMSKHELKAYKWLFNCVDLFSKYTYSVPVHIKSDEDALELKSSQGKS